MRQIGVCDWWGGAVGRRNRHLPLDPRGGSRPTPNAFAALRLISERDLLREQQRAHDDRHEHRIAEIVGTLTNEDDPQARYDARARLHQILGRYIAAVLKPGRTVTVSIGAHSGMAPANAVIGPDGLREISVIDPHDGTVLMTYDRASLCLLDPIKARPSALMSARACALNAAQPFAEPTAA